MALYRVTTIMTGVPGAPYYNALYFGTTVAAPGQPLVEKVRVFWQELIQRSDVNLRAQVQGDVEEVDPANGQTLSLLSLAPGVAVGGSSASTLPPTVQGLLRLRTATFISGRRVAGRVYIPALTTTAGFRAPLGVAITAWNGAANTLLASPPESGKWVVYSPTKGQAAAITAADTWSEFAVQRSRRD